MATKITILGEEPQKKELKKIEFIKGLTANKREDNVSFTPFYKPSEYDEITVIKSLDDTHYDLFVCKYHNGWNHYYLGHFNDGVV